METNCLKYINHKSFMVYVKFYFGTVFDEPLNIVLLIIMLLINTAFLYKNCTP